MNLKKKIGVLFSMFSAQQRRMELVHTWSKPEYSL
jgi:hypothetical protein